MRRYKHSSMSYYRTPHNMKKTTNHIMQLTLCSLLAICLLTSTGCASKRYGNLSSESSGLTSSRIGMNVVRTASTQLGKPYRLGGDSPRGGFDCSGLIYWSFRQNGISVPRVTSSQAKVGSKVAINSLQPGDIVVFRTKNAPNGLHTGIYVGSGRFIHSPNSRSKVRVDDLSTSTYWRKRLVMGRRLSLR